MSTFDRVKKIVVDQLGVNEADVTIDSTFIDDLGADSLDIVELIMAFEEEFDIEIPDDAADRYGVDRGTSKVIRERVIRKPIGFVHNKYNQIMECVRGERAYNSIVELDDFEIDDFKMEFSVGKRDKTISLKGLNQLVVNEDITNLVVIENGHPTFESLCMVMQETGEEYLRAKGAIE